MPFEEESWLPVAERLGFKTEEEMLKELYLTQMLSISKIAKLLGYSTFGIRGRLLRADISLRGRGGANTDKNKRSLIGVSDDDLFHSSVAALVDWYAVHPCTVSAERKRRRQMKKEIMEVQG